MSAAGGDRRCIITDNRGCIDRGSRSIADILGVHTWSEKRGRKEERENRCTRERLPVLQSFQ
jgi:hypothetical protein